jgi:hypothetical protein
VEARAAHTQISLEMLEVQAAEVGDLLEELVREGLAHLGKEAMAETQMVHVQQAILLELAEAVQVVVEKA